MKNTIKIFAINILTFISFQLVAQTNQTGFSMEVTEGKSFHFAFDNIDQDYLEIIFKDGNGGTIFSEYVVHPDHFSRTYNLSEIEEGKYYMLIKGETNTQIVPIKNESEQLVLGVQDIDLVKNDAAPLLN